MFLKTMFWRNYLFAGLFALCAALSRPVLAQDEPLARQTGMAIAGYGQYDIAPERLTFSGNVKTEGDTADAAVKPHFAEVARIGGVIDSLVPKGLTLKTSRYNLRSDRPLQYDGSPNLTAEEKARVVYSADTFYSFIIEDLAAVPAIISALAASGIGLSGMDFSVHDERAARLEARKLAAQDALEQAEVYAEALGLDLVGVRSVTDGDARPFDGAADLAIDLREQLTIAVPETIGYYGSVNVVWDIAPKAP